MIGPWSIRPTLWLAAVLFGATGARAQRDSLAIRYANTITEEDLHRHLSILAGDDYEGRETGFKGQKMAAEYLREQFRSFGIGPVSPPGEHGVTEGYFQPFELILSRPGAVRLHINGVEQRFLMDHFYFSENLRSDVQASEVLVVGPKADLTKLDLKGKWVVFLGADRSGRRTELQVDVLPRMAALRQAGAAVVFVALPDADAVLKEFGHQVSSPRMRLKYLVDEQQGNGRRAPSMQSVFLNDAATRALLAADHSTYKRLVRNKVKGAKAVPADARLGHVPNDTVVTGENVLAFIEGSDKRDEVIVVTAHYDHIGMDGNEVFNGADDDGSGTVALLEMAEAFARAKREGHGPRRSILFMPVAGEEKGLLGSRYYSDHPVFPLTNTVANLNIDMIGRTDSAHAQSAPYVYVIGSDRLSTDLHRINEEANATYVGIHLDHTFNAPDDPNKFYYRSDHYNFARKGVPAIFYFSGVHEDYHGPGDEVSKIRFDLLRVRTALVFHTAWALAQREERIVVDGTVEPER